MRILLPLTLTSAALVGAAALGSGLTGPTSTHAEFVKQPAPVYTGGGGITNVSSSCSYSYYYDGSAWVVRVTC